MEPEARRTASTAATIDPALTFLDDARRAWCRSQLDDFGAGRDARARRAGQAARRPPTATTVSVTTVYDLLMAQYGVPRGLDGRLPGRATTTTTRRTRRPGRRSTPAWAATTLIRFAREWGDDRRADQRQVHDHHRRRHQPLVPRQPDVPGRHPRADVLRLRRRQRRRPGALRRPGEAGARRVVGRRSPSARTGIPASRLQNAPSWHYVHTDQWRYEKAFTDYHTVPPNQPRRQSLAQGHTMDVQVARRAQRLAALLPAVQREPARAWCEEARGGGRDDRRGDRRATSSSS